MNTIAIIDYGMGNLHSIAKALERVAPSARVIVTDRSPAILDAARVVLPGVGAIRDCMAELERRGLIDTVRATAADRPFLGICIGLQMLFDRSEENDGVDCLGIVPGRVRRFAAGLERDGVPLKIPHMGWNGVTPVAAHPLWDGIAAGSRFYFVHSYYVQPSDAAVVAATAVYGHPFAAAVACRNLFAVQFHPEKSHRHGLRLLSNFAAWNGVANHD